MLLQWAEKITSFFVKQNFIDPKMASWCIYSLQRRLLSFVSWSALLVLGTFLCDLWSTICFLLGFLLLRRRAGGYHARSPLQCVLYSVIQECICFCILYPICALAPVAACMLLTLFALITVFLTAPVTVKALRLTDAEKAGNKKLARRVIVLEGVLILSFLCLNANSIAIFSALGVACAANSLWIEKIRNRKEQNEHGKHQTKTA